MTSTSMTTTLPIPAQTSASAISRKTTAGLTTGAKAGIGVAVGVVGALLIAILALCLLKRRKRKQNKILREGSDKEVAPSNHGASLNRTHELQDGDNVAATELPIATGGRSSNDSDPGASQMDGRSRESRLEG